VRGKSKKKKEKKRIKRKKKLGFPKCIRIVIPVTKAAGYPAV
jgi:hypothetical protein